MRFVLPLLAVAAVASGTQAAPRFDLAIQSIRVPARVALTDARGKSIAHAAVRIAYLGAGRFSVPDEATLAGLVRLSATSLDGPVACAPLAITPGFDVLHFPIAIGHGRSRTLHYRLEFTCGANPDRATPDWAFSA